MSRAATVAEPLRITAMDRPRRYLDLQRGFYRGDPDYVPPLTWADAWVVDRRRNPWFEHGEAEFFVAWRGARAVGRISAARDRLHDEFHGDRVGFFGHFEAADAATAQALLEHATAWLRERGATELRGPVNLSTNYHCGLLVEGQPGPPVVMMNHNPPQYAAWLEAFGLRKAKDLLALYVHARDIDLPRLERVFAHMQKRANASFRPLDVRRFDAELDVLWRLYNQIWETNWGFAPMSEREFKRQARELKPVVHPALMHLALVDGEPAGFVVGVPDVNVGIKRCNGRLLPFGWWQLLRTIRRLDFIRVITLGVLPRYRSTGLQVLLLHQVITKGIAAGFYQCEASWILEDNRDMLGPLEKLGHRPYRRYRIYHKELA